MTPQSIFQAVSEGKWKKALGMAVFLVACDPFNPWGSCGDVPSCSAVTYRIALGLSGTHAEEPLINGTYEINKYAFWIRVTGEYDSQQVACPNPGRRGVAYALSCAPCSGPFLLADSLYFTTDILTVTGDTLKAGYNFADGIDLPGINGEGKYLFIDQDSTIRFRDSLFEIRFTGHVDSVQKTVVSTVRITNPTMLFP